MALRACLCRETGCRSRVSNSILAKGLGEVLWLSLSVSAVMHVMCTIRVVHVQVCSSVIYLWVGGLLSCPSVCPSY